jgi:hypothetical protein
MPIKTVAAGSDDTNPLLTPEFLLLFETLKVRIID